MKWLWAPELVPAAPGTIVHSGTASALSLCSSPDTWGPKRFLGFGAWPCRGRGVRQSLLTGEPRRTGNPSALQRPEHKQAHLIHHSRLQVPVMQVERPSPHSDHKVQVVALLPG